MRTTTLVASFLVLCTLAGASLPAQVLRIERRGYARLCHLRNELLSDVLEAGPEVREKVAAILAEDAADHPFARLGVALAAARGVEPDEEFLFRSGIVPMVLPEVVDQDRYREAHVTMHAPRILPDIGPCVFEIRLVDPDGETLRRSRIADAVEREDLLRFRATTPVDLHGLPDGRYEVRVDTVLDGERPRPVDVAARTHLCVLRSFVSRAQALPAVLDDSAESRARAHELASRIPESRRDPLSHAILTGAVWQVERVYRGEPRVPGGDAVGDLERAERIFQNLVADRDPLAGLSGRVTIGLPVAGAAGDAADAQSDVVVVSIDLGPPSSRDVIKPLVLVVGGVPTWTARASRPTSPRTVVPAWTLDQLSRAGFDAERRFHVAVLESPGRFSSAPRVVVEATRQLRQILSVDPERVFWVGEREGAFAVSRAALVEPEAVAGLVLVAGGGLSARDLEALPRVRVLCVPAQDHPATTGLTQLARQVGDPERVRLNEPRGVPWPLALGVAADAIESFLQSW